MTASLVIHGALATALFLVPGLTGQGTVPEPAGRIHAAPAEQLAPLDEPLPTPEIRAPETSFTCEVTLRETPPPEPPLFQGAGPPITLPTSGPDLSRLPPPPARPARKTGGETPPAGGQAVTGPKGHSDPAPPTDPVPLLHPEPPYPQRAIRRGWEGVVVLEIEILASGDVGDVAVATSSGYEVLDEAARETVRTRWTFIPATRNGQAVTARVPWKIRFRLD